MDEGPRWKKGEQSDIVITQTWEDGDLDEAGSSRGGENGHSQDVFWV